MKNHFYLIPLSILLSIQFVLKAQNAESTKAVLEKTNIEGLKLLGEEIEAKYVKNKQRAEDLATTNNWPLRQELNDGTVIELQGVSENGQPLYYTTHNAAAAISTSTNDVWAGGSLGLNLDGTGMIAGEWDGGAVRLTHQEFMNTGVSRVTQVDGVSSTHYHSTHVAGTIIAGGVVSNAKGMAYNANLHAYDWNSDESEMAIAAANGLLISNHSYGYVSGWAYNGLGWTWYGDESISNVEDYHFGFYADETREIDLIANNAPYYLIVKSAGNDRGDGPGLTPPTAEVDGGADGFDCIGWKGNAKNILTVGAVLDVPGGYSDDPTDVGMTTFSSWGPTDDGRIKPDICGNGYNLYSTYDSYDTEYNSISGTSMSAPNVTGSLLLLQEHYFENNGSYLLASTLKALAIHTADECGPNPGPDYMFGWGLLNTAKAAALISNNNISAFIKEESYSGTTYFFDVDARGDVPLVVTMVWNDPAGTPVTAALDPSDVMLVNDLDITVADGTTHYPYKLDVTNPSSAATTGNNDVDNVEKVYIPTPNAGSYTITVTHEGALSGSNQDFSLIISGVNNGYPFVTTTAVTNILENSVQTGGNVVSEGDYPITERGIVYATTALPTTTDNKIVDAGSGLGVYAASITGLVSNTTYFVRAYAINADGTIYGHNIEFKTDHGYPYFEGFEGDLGKWLQVSFDDFNWLQVSGTTPSSSTGPLNAYEGSKYIYTEASSPNYPSKTAIIEANFNFTNLSNPGLFFYYHMYGSTMGTLYIDVFDGLAWQNNFWSITDQQQTSSIDPFRQAMVDISSLGGKDGVEIRFRGETGSNYYSDICIDQVEIMQTTPILFSSATTSQIPYSVFAGEKCQKIIRVEIETDGVLGTVELSQLDFNTIGTTDAANIANAQVFFTGSSADFDTTNSFGLPVLKPNGYFAVTGTENLIKGINYLWLTYDIESASIPGNVLDAQCTGMIVGGTSEVPDISNPSGVITILAPPVLALSTNFIDASVNVCQASVTHSFEIENTGQADLTYVLDGVSNSNGNKVLALTYGVDMSGEYANTITAINQYYTNYELTEVNTSEASVLEDSLFNKSVLLIPEIESGSSIVFIEFASVLQEFANSGGTIVTCGSSSNYQVLSTGLIIGTDGEILSSGEMSILNRSHQLMQGIIEPINAQNATFGIRVNDPDAIVLAEIQSNDVLVYKKYGKGSVIYLGYDFWAYDTNASQLIANAIEYGCESNLFTPSWLSFSPIEGTVSSGGYQQISVDFDAYYLNAGIYTHDLVVTTNDPVKKTDTVVCQFNVTGSPKMLTSGNEVNFPITYIDFQEVDSITIYNQGCDTLKISDVLFSSSVYSSSLSMFNVLPDDSIQLRITFVPTSIGVFAESLTIKSNDGDLVINLTGQALEAPGLYVNTKVIDASVAQCGDSITHFFVIENIGGADLEYNMPTDFYDGFENGLDNWTWDGLWGLSTNSYQGSYALTESPDGNYGNSWNQNIELVDALHIQNAQNCNLTYWIYKQMEGCCDYFRTQISVNGGSWETLQSVNGTTGWSQSTFNLDIYVNDGDQLRVRFNFSSDGSVVYDGVSIDDFEVSGVQSDWINYAPNSGIISAGNTQQVAVEFNAKDIGIGIYNADIVIYSNDPNNVSDTIECTFEANGTPDISSTSTSLLFSEIPVTTPSLNQLIIQNTGCDTLFISNIISSSSVFVPVTSSDTVLPDSNSRIDVYFTPTQTILYAETLTVVSNDPVNPNYIVNVTGQGVDRPEIIVSKNAIDFGTVEMGNDKVDSYMVSASNMLDDLVIFAPDGFVVSQFEFSGYDSSLVLYQSSGMIAPRTIYVRFAPSDIKSYHDFILNGSVYANNANIDVSGTGEAPSAAVILTSKDALEYGDVKTFTDAVQSYSLSAYNIKDSVHIIVPYGFSVSLEPGANFYNRISFYSSTGHIIDTTIYVKFHPTTLDVYSGYIQNESLDISSVEVAVSGTSFGNNTVFVERTSAVPVIDGLIDSVWNTVRASIVNTPWLGEQVSYKQSPSFKAIWDNENVYVLVDVPDDDFYPYRDAAVNPWQADLVELYFDVNAVREDGGGPSLDPGHYQFAPPYDYSWDQCESSYWIDQQEESYRAEYKIPLANLTDEDGVQLDPMIRNIVGFDITIIDLDQDGFGDNISMGRVNWSNDVSVEESWANLDWSGDFVFVEKAPVETHIISVETNDVDGYYKIGDTINLFVVFDDVVTVDKSRGIPSIQLNASDSAFAFYESGSGSKQLWFTFIVSKEHETPILDYTSKTALCANGGLIQNNGVSVSLKLPQVGVFSQFHLISIDNTIPLAEFTYANNMPSSLPLKIMLEFNEIVKGLDLNDFSLINASIDTIYEVIINRKYELSVNPTSPDEISIELKDSAVVDLGGNFTEAIKLEGIFFDALRPTVQLNTNSPLMSNNKVIVIDVAFSEGVRRFDSSCLIINDQSKVVVKENTPGIHYTLEIEPLEEGALSIGIDTSLVADSAGNNLVSTDKLVFMLDWTLPSVEISTEVLDYLRIDSLVINAEFSEEISGFDSSSIYIKNGQLKHLLLTTKELTYQLIVIPDDQGEVVVEFMDNLITDIVGNSLGNKPVFKTIFDTKPPEVMISSEISGTTRQKKVPIRIVFNEPVSGLGISSITISNGIISKFMTFDDKVFDLEIAAQDQGKVSILVKENKTTDVAGNSNIESNEYTYVFDNMGPFINSFYIDELGIESANLNILTNEKSKLFYVVVPYDEPKPSDQEIESFTVVNAVAFGEDDLEVGKLKTIKLDMLSQDTYYASYLLSKDSISNKSMIYQKDFLTATVGLNSFDKLGLVLYPNPNNGQFYIECKNENLIGAKVSIIDINGREILSFEIAEDKQVIELVGIAKGMYIMQTKSHEEYIRSTFIVD